MKKLLLGLGSITSIVAPVTTLVACGDKSPEFFPNLKIMKEVGKFSDIPNFVSNSTYLQNSGFSALKSNIVSSVTRSGISIHTPNGRLVPSDVRLDTIFTDKLHTDSLSTLINRLSIGDSLIDNGYIGIRSLMLIEGVLNHIKDSEILVAKILNNLMYNKYPIGFSSATSSYSFLSTTPVSSNKFGDLLRISKEWLYEIFKSINDQLNTPSYNIYYKAFKPTSESAGFMSFVKKISEQIDNTPNTSSNVGYVDQLNFSLRAYESYLNGIDFNDVTTDKYSLENPDNKDRLNLFKTDYDKFKADMKFLDNSHMITSTASLKSAISDVNKIKDLIQIYENLGVVNNSQKVNNSSTYELHKLLPKDDILKNLDKYFEPISIKGVTDSTQLFYNWSQFANSSTTRDAEEDFKNWIKDLPREFNDILDRKYDHNLTDTILNSEVKRIDYSLKGLNISDRIYLQKYYSVENIILEQIVATIQGTI